MRIHKVGRQMGKTVMLLEWLEGDPKRAMIVHSYQESDRLKRENPHLADQIFNFHSALDGRLRGRGFNELAIDNLDLILPWLLGCKIGPITTTEG